MKQLGVALLLLTSAAVCQNLGYHNAAFGPSRPNPNALVAVCTQPANTNVQPCSPLATLCSGLSNTTCTVPNPLPSDALGNDHFDGKGSVGLFAVQIYGPQVIAPTALTDQGSFPSTTGVLNGAYYPASCGSSSTAPSWCSGSEMGAWVNAAIAASPSGTRIHITASSTCYSFTTPIVFGSGKYDTLEGDPGGGSCIKYTPTAGVAITFDPGVTEHQAYGIRDLQLIGPGNTTSTTGLLLGLTNGAEGAVVSGFKTATNCCTHDGFGTGIAQGSGSTFVFTIENSFIMSNGWGLTLVGGENVRLLNNVFSQNTTGPIKTSTVAWMDIYSYGNAYDDNGGPITLVATGGLGNHFTSAGDHFENVNLFSGTLPYISIANNAHVTISGGVMLDDHTSGITTAGMIACSGTSIIYIYGMGRATAGSSINPFIKPSGNCRADVRFSQSTGTFTDYPSTYTGGAIFNSNMTSSAGASFQLLNAGSGANIDIPFGNYATSRLTGNLSSTQVGGFPTTYAGLYLVCVSIWPTATGSATAIQATITSSANGTAYTTNVGSVLSLSSLANIGGGCTGVATGSRVTFSVATTGYAGTGTYSLRASVVEIQ
jgi:hypothetical protein